MKNAYLLNTNAKKCGHVMEFLERNSGGRKRLCQQCKDSDLQKLFSSFSVGRSSNSNPLSCDSCPTGLFSSAGTCPDDTCPMS